MTCQLPSDCLNEIFECFEEDTLTLHSYLLTAFGVEFLALTEEWNFISTTTAKKPLFNYAAFCRVHSVRDISRIVDNAFKDKPLHNSIKLRR
ncbi:hypothetical protein RhiirA5_418817 [Rhizophagus irregularis]|uniref:Uncharacterized protein n=1 Tax=Rhizophagus irregularis TaxID=588596 RepID=A0A2N0PJI5_9GLOM|nr:hypothetical protein RhiirA5_418817 [Rhizophagus irregularis]PKC67340.1 hypothetical protein RhiirA1_458545 [Rhizophagus irregularis]